MSSDPPDERRRAIDLENRRLEIERQLGEPVTLDRLTAEWVMYQRKRGHRHSTDDLLTAWYAIQHGFPADRLLDLGTGIGTVGLLVLSQRQSAKLTAVEAQEISFNLFQHNLWANGQVELVKAIHADLRHAVLDDAAFDLITGSPPYFDVSAGIVPQDSQKAHARFELRGTVFDYCRVAKRALAPNGAFVFCFPYAQKSRAERACTEHDLPIARMRDVVPRAGLPPLFTLFLCRHTHRESRVDESPFVVRDESGRHTEEMTALRGLFGMKAQ